MATLTFTDNACESTRATLIDLVSRPAMTFMASMALSAARDEVIVDRPVHDDVSGRRRGVRSDLSGHSYALTMPSDPSNVRSQCDSQLNNRLAAVINQSKSIQSTDEGFNVKHDGMGAFATSLGSRPPSPPV